MFRIQRGLAMSIRLTGTGPSVILPPLTTTHRAARVTIRAGGKTLASGTLEMRPDATADELFAAEMEINGSTNLRVWFDVEGSGT